MTTERRAALRLWIAMQRLECEGDPDADIDDVLDRVTDDAVEALDRAIRDLPD